MHARYFSIFFLFTLLVVVFATPLPEPKLSADDIESGVAARDTQALEIRASGRVSLFYSIFSPLTKYNLNLSRQRTTTQALARVPVGGKTRTRSSLLL